MALDRSDYLGLKRRKIRIAGTKTARRSILRLRKNSPNVEMGGRARVLAARRPSSRLIRTAKDGTLVPAARQRRGLVKTSNV